MPRPLRIEGENLWYHVYNRGNEKRDIFISDADNRLFLDILFRCAADFQVEVHAYALMLNHFHFLIMTREANLCRFMHEMLGGFVGRYNAAHARVGHVFQGRYKAIVVDTHEYGRALLRYIHLNPARTKRLGDAASLRERLRVLRDYPWSSYRAYAGMETCPWPLHTAELLADFGDTPTERRRRFARFVKEGLLTETDPFTHIIAKSILGSDAFVDKIKRLVQDGGRHDHTALAARRRVTALYIEAVIAAVADEYGVTAAELLSARVKPALREARRVLLWAAARHCIGRFSIEEIGQRLGGVTHAAVGHARAKIEHDIALGKDAATHACAIARRLMPDDALGNVADADEEWLDLYRRLVAYHKKYGHAMISRNHPADLRLGAWAERQRLVRKGLAANATPLTDRQIALLDNLGFLW